ncbi:hypothetical protein FRC03_005257 [Tulasnella sp. 419]|nr:hypothetical protein FRC03_005257 [Tulasnella sp. 419]
MTVITSYATHDVRFPTNLTGDGSDAMNFDCDYSAATITIYTDSNLLTGHGMTFTIGRGNNIVCEAIKAVAERIIGKKLEDLFADMGNTWDYLVGDPQLRWIGPEKGVIHLATAAVDNAIWDLFAKSRGKPLWKLIADMSPEEFVRSTTFRYISDVITPEEALQMLREKESGKAEREELVRQIGYPAYITSAGWLRYDDAKVARLTKEAIASGFTHFKMKVGADFETDLRRAKLIRSIIDDPASFPPSYKPSSPGSLANKNAGPTGCVLMMDANQVWDVKEAIEWTQGLAEAKPWFIEEPTAPDDILGHAAIRKALKPLNIGVATGEHAHNRMTFKQLLQAEAIDVCQIDACRLAGVSEVLSVLLMASKYKIPICPHAGGVGLCEHALHLSLIDYIVVSGTMERNVLEVRKLYVEVFTYVLNLDAVC